MTEPTPEPIGALPAIPPGWPAHSLPEIRAELCASGQPFEIEIASQATKGLS